MRYAMYAGRLVEASEQFRWQEGCICPECREAMVFKGGQIREHHFSHHPTSKCRFSAGGGGGGKESEDHFQAKFGVQEHSASMEFERVCMHCKQVASVHLINTALEVEFAIQDPQSGNKYKIDVGNDEAAVEVKHKHFVPNEKWSFLRNRYGAACFEIHSQDIINWMQAPHSKKPTLKHMKDHENICCKCSTERCCTDCKVPYPNWRLQDDLCPDCTHSRNRKREARRAVLLHKQEQIYQQKLQSEKRIKMQKEKAQSEKIREEAQRLAQEEAQRLAQEEAQRLAQEEAQRLAQEEALLLAREAAERSMRVKRQQEREKREAEEQQSRDVALEQNLAYSKNLSAQQDTQEYLARCTRKNLINQTAQQLYRSKATKEVCKAEADKLQLTRKTQRKKFFKVCAGDNDSLLTAINMV
jgi:flagellar biosynthesis GTPase FlhF